MNDRIDVDALRNLVLLAAMFDLDAAENALTHADTVGPILDPTGYIKAGTQLEEMREALRALRPFHRFAVGVYARLRAQASRSSDTEAKG